MIFVFFCFFFFSLFLLCFRLFSLGWTGAGLPAPVRLETPLTAAVQMSKKADQGEMKVGVFLNCVPSASHPSCAGGRDLQDHFGACFVVAASASCSLVFLFLLLQRLKQGTPDFHAFIKVRPFFACLRLLHRGASHCIVQTAKKYQEQLVSLIDLGKNFSDSLMKLSTNFRGDLEEGIRKMAEAQREIERRRLEMSEHLLREVVQPLGRSVESESRYELPAFEKVPFSFVDFFWA